MGRRGTNQLRTINVAVPADSLGYWADRLRDAGIDVEEAERFGTQRLDFAHPCGIPYSIVGETGADDREPWDGGDVPARARDPRRLRHHHLGARARADGRLPAPRRWAPSTSPPRAPHHQYRIGTDEGGGRLIELVEEPDLPQGTWSFGEGTIHHHAFDVGTPEDQAAVKDWIVGLGYTDVSDVKDRGYFHSVYMRTPGGALFELAARTSQGFTIDEPEEELGTHMCIPPHWEDRRSEIDQLEPIDTLEEVV